MSTGFDLSGALRKARMARHVVEENAQG
jgi:hypothetical protein